MEKRMTLVAKESLFGEEFTICGSAEEPLFKASEVQKWLGMTNGTQMIKSVPESEVKKMKVWHDNSARWTNYLTEFGVYFLIMRSNKPGVLKYQYRIAEILKSIRLKGYAVSENITEEQIAQLKKDAENKEMLLKSQGGVIRVDDRFVSSLKKLIDIYENERSKLSEVNAEELFEDK